MGNRIEIALVSGKEIAYRVINGTYYHADTAPAVIAALEAAAVSLKLTRIYLGDPDTGRSWMEENDTIGYIGRYRGSVGVPILIEPGFDHGPSILDHKIIRIDYRKAPNKCETVYQHPAFHIAPIAIFEASIPRRHYEVRLQGGTVVARFRSQPEAEEYILFLSGHRFKQDY